MSTLEAAPFVVGLTSSLAELTSRRETAITPAVLGVQSASAVFRFTVAELRASRLTISVTSGISRFLEFTRGFFPTSQPTARQFKPPAFPFSTAYTMNNRATRTLMASKAGQATLDLTYDNLSDADAHIFLLSYNSCQGSLRTFQLPQQALRGAADDLRTYLDTDDTSLSWRWDAPPTFNSISKGRTSVEVRLRAYTAIGVQAIPVPAPLNPYTPTYDLDTTKYTSFEGTTPLQPPDPPTPQNGTKWISYNSNSYAASRHANPVVDAEGNIYQVRVILGDIYVTKYLSNGSVGWQLVGTFTEDSPNGETFPVDSSLGPSDGFSIHFIKNDLIVVYGALGYSAYASFFGLIGIRPNGTVVFKKRLPAPDISLGLSFIVKFIPHPSSDYFIGVSYTMASMTAANNGIAVYMFSCTDGTIIKQVRVHYPSSGGSTGVAVVRDFYFTAAAKLQVVVGAGGTLLFELDSDLTDIIRAYFYQFVSFTTAAYSSYNDTTLFYSNGSSYTDKILVMVDPSLQIVQHKISPSLSPALSNYTKLKWLTNYDYVLVTDSAFGKFNWLTDDFEWWSSSSGIFSNSTTTVLNPNSSKFYFSYYNTNYSWLAKSDALLPVASPTVSTGAPVNVSFTASTNYQPSYTFSDISYNSPRSAVQLAVTDYGPATGSTLSCNFDLTNPVYDVVTDVE